MLDTQKRLVRYSHFWPDLSQNETLPAKGIFQKIDNQSFRNWRQFRFYYFGFS